MSKSIFKNSIKNIAIILLIAIFFIADRYLKYSAINLGVNSFYKIIDGIFLFNFTANYNISFSLPLGGDFLIPIIILAILAIISLILYLIIKKKGHWLDIYLLTFILFGAISNILDRLFFGYVIDYLELKYFTVFNLADMIIVGGAVGIIIRNLNTNTNIHLKPKGMMTDFSENLTFICQKVKNIIADLANGQKMTPSKENAVQLLILHDLAEIIKKAKTNNVFDEIILEKVLTNEYKEKAKSGNYTAFYNFRRVLEDERFVNHLKTLLN